MKIKVRIVYFLAGFVLWLAACGSISQGDKIKIGLIAELSGDIPAIGLSCKNAAELAVNEINAAGGLEIGGKHYAVELFVQDNGGQVDQSMAVALQLITQQNVIAIIGPNATRYAIPAAQVAEDYQTVLISPSSSDPQTTLDLVSGEPRQYVFRVAQVDSAQGRAAARFANQRLKADKAAVLYDASWAYSSAAAQGFKQAFQEQGQTITVFEASAGSAEEFSAQLTRVIESGAQALFLPNFFSDVARQVQQARRMGFQAPILGSDSWHVPDLPGLCGVDCQETFFSTQYASGDPAPGAERFARAYAAAYGTAPDATAALTYDAFGLLWQALQSAGAIDRQALRDALANSAGFGGVTGNISFQNGSGDPAKSACMAQILAGGFAFDSWIAP